MLSGIPAVRSTASVLSLLGQIKKSVTATQPSENDIVPKNFESEDKIGTKKAVGAVPTTTTGTESNSVKK